MPIYSIEIVQPARETECFVDVPDQEAARVAGHRLADDLLDEFAEAERQVRVHPDPVEASELEADETVWVGEVNAVGDVRGKWVPVRDLRAAIEAYPEPEDGPVATPGQHDFFGGEVSVE
jgi:hypothetical protein